MNRVILGMALSIVAMVFGLWYAARLFQYGSDAKSPQTVTLLLGQSAFVAGGRAKLWFAAGSDGTMVEVRCAKEERMIYTSELEPSEECCGIRVKGLGIEEPGNGPVRGKFEVTWDERAK